jgi:tetratricopeptide (TPR) repeat protein
MKRYDDAIREIHEVTRLDPNNVKALYRKATVQEAQGLLDEALATIESAPKDEKMF